jgi:hypothetical protein
VAYRAALAQKSKHGAFSKIVAKYDRLTFCEEGKDMRASIGKLYVFDFGGIL